MDNDDDEQKDKTHSTVSTINQLHCPHVGYKCTCNRHYTADSLRLTYKSTPWHNNYTRNSPQWRICDPHMDLFLVNIAQTDNVFVG